MSGRERGGRRGREEEKRVREKAKKGREEK